MAPTRAADSRSTFRTAAPGGTMASGLLPRPATAEHPGRAHDARAEEDCGGRLGHHAADPENGRVGGGRTRGPVEGDARDRVTEGTRGQVYILLVNPRVVGAQAIELAG